MGQLLRAKRGCGKRYPLYLMAGRDWWDRVCHLLMELSTELTHQERKEALREDEETGGSYDETISS